MKPLRLIVAGMAILFAYTMQAQVSINVNIGARPAWGPTIEEGVRYYYLPEVEAYYDIPSSMFVYIDNGQWVHRHYLPERFRNYDLYHGRKIVINDYRGNTPYTHCRYTERYVPVRESRRFDYDRPGKEYYRDNDRRSYSYNRDNDRNDRDDRNHGRGHAYGRNKDWKD